MSDNIYEIDLFNKSYSEYYALHGNTVFLKHILELYPSHKNIKLYYHAIINEDITMMNMLFDQGIRLSDELAMIALLNNKIKSLKWLILQNCNYTWITDEIYELAKDKDEENNSNYCNILDNIYFDTNNNNINSTHNTNNKTHNFEMSFIMV